MVDKCLEDLSFSKIAMKHIDKHKNTKKLSNFVTTKLTLMVEKGQEAEFESKISGLVLEFLGKGKKTPPEYRRKDKGVRRKRRDDGGDWRGNSQY